VYFCIEIFLLFQKSKSRSKNIYFINILSLEHAKLLEEVMTPWLLYFLFPPKEEHIYVTAQFKFRHLYSSRGAMAK